jgi:predicted O-linked N-acetylglucosamine transferase (SPINDLY family)
MPNDAEIAKHMGVALYRMQRWNDAVPFFLQAIELYDGDYLDAVEGLAGCLLSANRIDEARVCLQELLRAAPGNVLHMSSLVHANLKRCYWDGLDQIISHLRADSSNFSACCDNPFIFSSVASVTRTELLDISGQFARRSIPLSVLSASMSLPYAPSKERRIRVGYLSGDFLQHAVGFIVPDVLERHDRSRFEIFAYSTREAKEDDPIRPRLERAFDHFNDINQLSMRDLRDRIRADEIDVLVDLSGWTSYGRPEVLALRCAPVQVNWLGYPGTIGHPALADYIIGDPTVTPLEHANDYSEAIAQLPHCYLPVDSALPLGQMQSRKEAGLPEHAFVFSSHNNSYKLNPQVFDLWCDILRTASDSVLWLSSHGDIVSEHLWQEAEKRGVSRERILFAERVSGRADHLARLSLADLALDTFPYNSHSTAIDALWAGVPMITMQGELFASRVGASVMTAAGLPELVVADIDAYREMALSLYRDRDRLSAIRKHLSDDARAIPLFDMGRFAASLESLYCRMLDNASNGLRRHLPAA